jgi:hypothetical protein
MHGGMLVLCDIPESVSEPTTFNPQRAQILVGFEYSMARASVAPAGFTLSNLVGGVPQPPSNITIPGSETIPGSTVTSVPPAATLPPQAAEQALASRPEGVRLTPFSNGTRWALIAAGLVLLLVATNVALRKVRESMQ